MRVAAISRLAKVLCLVLSAMVPWVCWSAPPEVRYEIHFPDIQGCKALACDLHMHTVFSDGLVWPTVRVNEAWRQGLHALAITDHIEYQPHKDDVPTKHARPYQLAESAARAHNLLLVRAAEITRDTPPGHFNALFLEDIKPLDTPEFLDAIKQANQQAAFVFWNHQGWKGEEKGQWLEVHETMFQNKWFQGMEVANGDEYYPTAHRWCLEKDLTMLGNSDIHDADLRRSSTSQDHRTMTLVFVKEPTLAGLKEALQQRRTVVWFKDQLIGREDLLRALFEASVRVARPNVRAKTSLTVEIRNDCQADLRLDRTGAVGPLQIVLPARSTCLVKIAASNTAKPLELEYTATDLLVAPGKGLPVKLVIPGP